MTTVIRATGVQFSNADLPNLSPVVSNGLVAMFRPSNAKSGLTDLYNKDNQLTIVGSPELTATGVKANARNYLQTDISETASMTILAVAKPTTLSYSHIAGTYNSTKGGVGMWFAGSSGTISVAMSAATKSDALDTHTQQAWGNLAKVSKEQYVFAALVIDAENNTMQGYCPTVRDDRLSFMATSSKFSSRTMGNKIRIGSGYWGDWQSETIISEVAIYNKALDSTEIMTQYQYSKDYFKKKHNIDI